MPSAGPTMLWHCHALAVSLAGREEGCCRPAYAVRVAESRCDCGSTVTEGSAAGAVLGGAWPSQQQGSQHSPGHWRPPAYLVRGAPSSAQEVSLPRQEMRAAGRVRHVRGSREPLPPA